MVVSFDYLLPSYCMWNLETYYLMCKLSNIKNSYNWTHCEIVEEKICVGRTKRRGQQVIKGIK